MTLPQAWIQEITANHAEFTEIPLARSFSITDDDVVKLVALITEAQNSHICSIDLTEQLVTDKGIASLTTLSRLTSLTLCDNGKITDECVPHLLNIPSLEVLDISLTKATKIGLLQLLDSPSLKEISADHLKIDEEILEKILQNKKVVYLSMDASLLSEPQQEELQRHLEDNDLPIISYDPPVENTDKDLPIISSNSLSSPSHSSGLWKTNENKSPTQDVSQCEEALLNALQGVSQNFSPSTFQRAMSNLLGESSESANLINKLRPNIQV